MWVSGRSLSADAATFYRCLNDRKFILYTSNVRIYCHPFQQSRESPLSCSLIPRSWLGSSDLRVVSTGAVGRGAACYRKVSSLTRQRSVGEATGGDRSQQETPKVYKEPLQKPRDHLKVTWCQNKSKHTSTNTHIQAAWHWFFRILCVSVGKFIQLQAAQAARCPDRGTWDYASWSCDVSRHHLASIHDWWQFTFWHRPWACHFCCRTGNVTCIAATLHRDLSENLANLAAFLTYMLHTYCIQTYILYT